MRAAIFVLVSLGLAAPAAAQITPTHTFVPGTVISSSEVNANFALLANALNRTGGIMTGTLTSQQITPASSATYDLGVTGTRFRHLWLSGDATVGGALIVTGATTFTGAATFANTGLLVLDTNATHTLALTPGSNLTANRILTFTTGDASRTVTIGGDTTISQDYSTTGAPQFAQLGLGAAVSTAALANVAGTFTGVTNAFGVLVTPDLTLPANGLGALVSATGTLIEAGSGTHALLAGVRIVAPTVTVGAATVTDTATLYISGAMSATVTGTNYALWVDSGNAKFDGNVTIDGSLTLGGSSSATLSALHMAAASKFTHDSEALSITCDGATENLAIAIADRSFLRFTTGGAGDCLIAGIAAPSDTAKSHYLLILNDTGQQLVLQNEDGSASASNRLSIIGASQSVAAVGALVLVWDENGTRWRRVQ